MSLWIGWPVKSSAKLLFLLINGKWAMLYFVLLGHVMEGNMDENNSEVSTEANEEEERGGGGGVVYPTLQ